MHDQGLSIGHARGTTRLKWHRLRRRASDPEFGAANLATGSELGASMEIDLQVRSDHGFVVMHDARLERETTGSGTVAAMPIAALKDLTYRSSGAPLLRSEELATLLGMAHPQALLQFDMKNDMEAIGAAGVAHLAHHFGAASGRLIVSGDSPALIRAIAEAIPGIKRGIDPTERLVATWRQDGLAAMERQLVDEIATAGRPEMVYLAWDLILAADAEGLDLVALCHAERTAVDAWTFTIANEDAGFSDGEWHDFSRLMALAPDQVTTDGSLAMARHWDRRNAI